jgi:hypothetical protein
MLYSHNKHFLLLRIKSPQTLLMEEDGHDLTLFFIDNGPPRCWISYSRYSFETFKHLDWCRSYWTTWNILCSRAFVKTIHSITTLQKPQLLSLLQTWTWNDELLENSFIPINTPNFLYYTFTNTQKMHLVSKLSWLTAVCYPITSYRKQ